MGDNGTGTVAYIGIGSNLGDRIAHLRDAIKAVKQLGGLLSVSSVYETEPFGVEDEEQPMYLNMVVTVCTELKPRQLLDELMKIELANGRIRHQRNESRTLDLDILLYGDEMIELTELEVPHPRMHQREFVMVPLAEIAPDLVLPKVNLSVSEIAEDLPNHGIRRVRAIDGMAEQVQVTSLASRPV